MTALANKHEAINLGQGFPQDDGPKWIREEAARALIERSNQYPPATGVPELRQAVAQHNQRFYGLEVDPDREIIVTSGATEALADCFQALVCRGDEVVVIEPYYDCYVPQILAAGGIPRFVRLYPPEWQLNEEALREAFSEKTKAIVLNTPMNPASKVFTREELELIATLVQEFDAYAICDEVYEHLLFDDRQHIPLMTLPGMRDRTIRIGSAGKTFSLTGWKIGYITASPEITRVVARSHQFVTFTSVPALQYAVAEGLASDGAYYQGLAREQQELRDRLQEGLTRIGFEVIPSHGTYFLAADIRPFGLGLTDVGFCEHITTKAKVAAIPMSAFFSTEGGEVPSEFVRFCFAKRPEVLDEALSRLECLFD